MLPYFFRHYDPFVHRYIFFDDGSTDGTLDILERHPRAEVRKFVRTTPESFVLSAQALHNGVWKESRGIADWTIITAVDEHLHHPDMEGYLIQQKSCGVSAVPALGYQMLATSFPEGDIHLAASLTFGAPFDMMSKLSIFDPSKISETNFELGRHSASPEGEVRYPLRDEVINLHYKYLGLDYVHARHQMLKSGLGALDVANNFGHRYRFSPQELESDYGSFEKRGVDIAGLTLAGHDDHAEPRWWRPR